MGLWWWDPFIVIYILELFVTNFSEIFWFGIKVIGWNQLGFIYSALLYHDLII